MKPKTKSQLLSSAMETVIIFLPVFEANSPDDFAQLLDSSEVTGEIPFLGHLEYRPAVYKFIDDLL